MLASIPDAEHHASLVPLGQRSLTRIRPASQAIRHRINLKQIACLANDLMWDPTLMRAAGPVRRYPASWSAR